MSQSRAVSLLEAGSNVVVGLALAFVIQIVVFPVIALEATLGQNGLLAGVFTMVSFLRGYTMRRLFEAQARRRGR